MQPRPSALIVIAKRPVPGRAKTRLTPPFGPLDAARLAAAALSDTLDAVDAAGAPARLLAFDGDPDGWLRPGWTLHEQVAGSLDVRLAAAFASATPQPTLLVGMDTPQVTPELLGLFDPERYDACLGPARDGGFWAVGLRDPRLAGTVLTGVPMSTSDTGRIQHRRLLEAGCRVQLLPELVDVDTAADAAAVAGAAPWTAFAREHQRLDASLADAARR